MEQILNVFVQTCVAVKELPLGALVEIECVAEIPTASSDH